MKAIQDMFDTHPLQPIVNEKLMAAISETITCAQVCSSCADACLNEEHVALLVSCIRLNLDCSAICNTTSTMLLRLTKAPGTYMVSQLQACAKVCEDCGSECEKHGAHAHCRICKEACRRCASACNELIRVIS